MDSISAEFHPNERLLRAIWPNDGKYNQYWKCDRPSSTCFKDRRGLSVNRTAGRDFQSVLEITKKSFSNSVIASVSVQDCKDINAKPKYLPSKSNELHSEIHKDDQCKCLSASQARELAKRAKIDYKPV